MNRIEIDVLSAISTYGLKKIDKSYNIRNYDRQQVEETIKSLQEKEYIEGEFVSEKGYDQIKDYKVDNAVILAAGLSTRCLPLSSIVPKGLYRIKGEVLIEREICQLHEVGITDITIVVGYKKEQFDYLVDKYGVKLIDNPDYNRYNNIVSVYLARQEMKNTYMLCSDNYYVENIFQRYEYDSYYACEYTDEYADEYCVTERDGDYIKQIKRGGEQSWYTIGAFYFAKHSSEIFVRHMEEDINKDETKVMLMDDFHIKYIDELPILMKRYNNIVYEFDTLNEIEAFDPSFASYVLEKCFNEKNTFKDRYNSIKKYNSVPTEQKEGRLHLNENLFGPSPKCIDALKSVELVDLYEYDLYRDDFLIEALAKKMDISPNCIFLQDGSSEAIKTALDILVDKGEVILLPELNWAYYKSIADVRLANVVRYNIIEEKTTYAIDINDVENKILMHSPKVVVITTPNMPTGCYTKFEDVKHLIEKYKDIYFFFDEAYWGFSNEEISPKLVEKYENVLISRTFSKFYGLANIRVGYCISHQSVNEYFKLNTPLFKISYLSRLLAYEALKDEEYYKKVKDESIEIREDFKNKINEIENFTAFDSYSNFLFIKTLKKYEPMIREALDKKKLLIRYFKENPDYLYMRITIAQKEILDEIIEIFKNLQQ